MLYDDFQNENSHYNCKDNAFRQNDIIIFRQNDIKTRKDKVKITSVYYVIMASASFCLSL